LRDRLNAQPKAVVHNLYLEDPMPGSIEEISSVFENLERSMFDVANGVQDGKEIRTAPFERTEELSRQLTALLKGHELLPRYILLRLSQAATILQNEAPYMPTISEQQEALRMSNAIQLTSSLILKGECHDDRRPGIPRIM
jgi:hypothetical protein